MVLRHGLGDTNIANTLQHNALPLPEYHKKLLLELAELARGGFVGDVRYVLSGAES